MTFTDWIAWAGLIIAFTAALFTALQWASSKRSAEASERSAGAAERSAHAAERSATSTQALTQLGQRPWIVLEPPFVSENQSGDYRGYSIAVRAVLRNVGSTPAFDVQASCQFGQWALPIPDGFVFDRPRAASMTVGPKVTLDLDPTPILVSNEHLREVEEGLRVLLFHGECSYKDFFGETHRTEWCLRYDFSRKSFSSFRSALNVMT